MLIYLTTGDNRDHNLQAMLAERGIKPTTERPAYGDPNVCGWCLQDAPCLLWLHDNRAVIQWTDNSDIPAADDLQPLIDAAVTAYEEANASPAE